MIETSKIAGLVCPGCHGDLASTQADLLCCPRCLGRYPLVDGIPSFVPGGPRASTASDSVDLTVLLVSPSEDSMAGLVARLQAQMADLNIRHELLPIDRSRAPSFVEEVRGRHILTLDREGISNPAVVPYCGKPATGRMWSSPRLTLGRVARRAGPFVRPWKGL